jgi:hypothetical protein
MAEQAAATTPTPETLWVEMRQKVVELIEECPAPEKHCARSAIRHIEKAWAIKDIDPEMAALRAITAEEECATAIFRALVRRKYVGASQVDPYNHVHKAAVAPFFDAIRKFLGVVEEELQLKYSVFWEDGNDRRIKLTFRAPFDPRPIFPTPPLHFSASLNDQPYDFSTELNAIASAKGAKSILRAIEERANKRNRMLYAAAQGIPTVKTPLDGFLTKTRDRVFGHLIVLLLVVQYRETQDFVQQALNGFLKILPRLKPVAGFN